MYSALGRTKVLSVYDVFTHSSKPLFLQIKLFRSFGFAALHFVNNVGVGWGSCFDGSHKARISAEAAWPCLGAGQQRPRPSISRPFSSQTSSYVRKRMFSVWHSKLLNLIPRTGKWVGCIFSRVLPKADIDIVLQEPCSPGPLRAVWLTRGRPLQGG